MLASFLAGPLNCGRKAAGNSFIFLIHSANMTASSTGHALWPSSQSPQLLCPGAPAQEKGAHWTVQTTSSNLGTSNGCLKPHPQGQTPELGRRGGEISASAITPHSPQPLFYLHRRSWRRSFHPTKAQTAETAGGDRGLELCGDPSRMWGGTAGLSCLESTGLGFSGLPQP